MGKEILYPVDTANFRNIRENGFVYVDKTAYIHSMTQSKGKYYFLARPRRFGKSLFLDTLAEFFSANRALFKGLAVDSLIPEEWVKYPVIRLNMSGKTYANPYDLVKLIEAQISDLERQLEVPSSNRDFEDRFKALICNVAEKYGKGVVVLIDEYDAPLAATIDNPELQELYRAQLHGLYSVLKNVEASIRFCMLTGVTRYGKVSVFSGLNNLNDISFSDEFAGICGITTAELRRYYHEGVEGLAKKFGTGPEDIYQRLKFDYDGYHFSPALIDIYNPFCINLVFSNQRFEDYWCRSGVPTILSKSLMRNDIDVEKLNGKKVPVAELSELSMYTADPVPLLYQTGYLTIKAYEERRRRCTVGYPNREVEAGIMRNILKVYTNSATSREGAVYEMEDALEEGRPRDFIKLLASFLADIPNQLHRHVDRYENYYHTIFYCLATLIGLDVEAEYSTAEGFIDLVVKTSGHIYIIELKVNGDARDAMDQIEARHYAAPFEADSRKVVKIGLGFSKDSGSISSFLIN